MHNILNNKKFYNLSKSNLKSLQATYDFWSMPENIMLGFTMHQIFQKLNQHAIFLQTSCIPLVEMVPTINNCYNNIKEFRENPQMCTSESFLKCLRDVINTDVVRNNTNGHNLNLLPIIEIPIPPSIQEKINKYVDTFLEEVAYEFKTRFIGDFSDDDVKEFYDEILCLCPKNIMNVTEESIISFQFLASVFKLNETAIISNIKQMAPELKIYHEECVSEKSTNLSFEHLHFNVDQNEIIGNISLEDDETNELALESTIRDEWENLMNFLLTDSNTVNF